MVEYSDFAPVVLKLLKGVVYYDDTHWNDLILHQRKIASYLGQIGLSLNISEPEGYAYISQPDSQDEDHPDQQPLPRLTLRRGLSFEVSLLCLLLREELERFDPERTESLKVFLTLSQIRDRIRVYFPEMGDEVRLLRELDTHISTLERLKYIRRIGADQKSEDQRYEIMPILKARVTPEFVNAFREKFESYGHTVS